MQYTAADSWTSLIDERYPAERSLLLRYHRALGWLDPSLGVGLPELSAQSAAEGARVLTLAEHRGVEIRACDESSLMATGTYKDLDACLITAIARRSGMDAIVASSGGNLVQALAAYSRRAGGRAFLFAPRSTLYKLDAADFGGGVRLIAVDLPERRVKSLARAFARRHGLPHVPEVSWRLAAGAARALHFLERTEAPGDRAQVIAQVMCAGYGPSGIYRCFSALVDAGMLAPARVPRLLGLQQEANAPMVRAWRAGDAALEERHVQPRPEEYLEPGLYNVRPDEGYGLLLGALRRHGGELSAVRREDLCAHGERVRGWLRRAGCDVADAPGRPGEPLEKAALITGAGVVQAIEEGRVRPGERVMYLITGGLRPRGAGGLPEPDACVDASRSEEAWVEELGRRFGLHAESAGGAP